MKGIIWVLTLIVTLQSISAATFEIKTSTDKLEIEESLGNVIQAISASEMPELKSSEVRTGAGTTAVRQYIRFQGLTPLKPSYRKNEANEVSDFLYAASTNNVNNALFEYELEFASGLKSNIKNGVLEDYVGKKIFIFSDEYIIAQGTKDGNTIEMTFLGGGSAELVNEGTSRVFTVDGTAYNVQVLAVEDTSKTVRLKVNDRELSRMVAGDSAPFDNVVVGISKIIFSNSPTTPDIVNLFVGKRSITLRDNFADNTFSQDVSVNEQRLSSSYAQISGSVSGSTFSLTDIKYRLTPEREIFIKPGEKLSQHLPKKEMMLGNWDISYDGLTTPTYNDIRLTPTGNNEYTLTFTNRGSQIMTIPFVSNRNGVFKLGDDDHDLIIQEGSNSNLNVDLNDYFVMTSRNERSGDTHVLRYESISTSASPPTVTFYDLSAAQTKTVTYSGNSTDNLTGSGTLIAGSGSGAITATVLVGSPTNNPVAIDLNGNGNADGSTIVDIVTAGGGILDLAALSGTTYTFNVKTERNQFEEATSDESVSVVIETRSGNTIGIRSTFGSLTTYSTSGHRKAMSNYGVKFDLLAPSSADAETLTISYPLQEAFAKAYIELGAGNLGTVTVSEETQATDRCSNGAQDGNETGVDCGGSCQPCQPTAGCSDNIKNQGETGIDCGGPCLPCTIGTVNESLCDGCPHVDATGNEACLAVSTVIGSLYCGTDKKIHGQKDNGASCDAAYECSIDICEQGKCGKEITPLLIFVNIGVIVVVLVLLYFVVSLMKKQSL